MYLVSNCHNALQYWWGWHVGSTVSQPDFHIIMQFPTSYSLLTCTFTQKKRKYPVAHTILPRALFPCHARFHCEAWQHQPFPPVSRGNPGKKNWTEHLKTLKCHATTRTRPPAGPVPTVSLCALSPSPPAHPQSVHPLTCHSFLTCFFFQLY